MIQCSVNDLVCATSAALLTGSPELACSGVAIDSRLVGTGGVFVAIAGERSDGNDFAASVLDAGASAVVLTRPADDALIAHAEACAAALLRAEDDDAEEFLLRLAAWWREGKPWRVVGVTGSVGKTTTKDMLACALGCRWRTHATAGNYNNLIGVPLTLLSAPADAEALVVEMGMNHPGEIARLAQAVRPQVALVTNVGTSHIGLLGSRENIARAKAEIVAGLASAPNPELASPMLFLQAGDDFSAFIAEGFAEPAGVPVTYVGAREGAAVRCGNVRLDDEVRPTFDVALADGTAFTQTLRLSGAQVVPDYELALAVALHLGVDAARAAEALACLEPTHMRQEVVHASRGFRVIDDSYNASPDSTAAALDALCAMGLAEGGRRIAILGEIGELGDEEARLHELVGAYAAAKPLDMLVVVGTDRADHLERAARLMGYSEDRIVRVGDVHALIEVVAPILEPADLVLVKASRAAQLDLFVKAVRA